MPLSNDRLLAVAIFVSPVLLANCGGAPAVAGTEEAVLASAPSVSPPLTRNHPTRVVVNLDAHELEGRLADGVQYTFWTFGGAVPGKFIRVREGDVVEFHLRNRPDSRMPHNIDLHAVTGPGGGATSSLVAPGQTATFVFKALNPGLFVYHCATAPVGMHVANGMYGLILVEPEGGLPPVDREYYVMQGEVYTTGAYGEPGLQSFSMEKALAEAPDYVVFGGSVGALTGDRALAARVGETVRLFVGNGGPNLISSFHVIGEIFDRVYIEAGTAVTHNIQTTLVPAGGAAIVEFAVQVPGNYLLVDHAIFRAFNKGALGMLAVTGPPDSVIYSGRIEEGVYVPEGGAVQTIPGAAASPERAVTAAERVAFGERVFAQNCAACHQADGEGIPGAFPPLARSDYLNADKTRAIRVLLNGLDGAVTVNGSVFNGVMPAVRLSDDDVANVLTYVYSQWGNSGQVVAPSEVQAARGRR
ncbi:MAG TPA: copper-containing nitrite reductase [Gemmatimonadales bacterium]